LNTTDLVYTLVMKVYYCNKNTWEDIAVVQLNPVCINKVVTLRAI